MTALVFPAWDYDPVSGFAGLAISAAATAAVSALSVAALAWVVERSPRPKRTRWIAASLVAASILVLFCVTAISVDTADVTGSDSVLALLRQDAIPTPGMAPGDERVYLQIFTFMHRGSGYYDAVRQAWAANWGGLPWGVTSYRMPTVFWLWRLLPSDPASIVWLFLGFSAIAMVSAFAIGSQLAGPGSGCLGALAMASYYLYSATSWAVTYVDPWGMAIGLAAVALFVTAVRRGDTRLVWAAAATAALASLLREHMVYISVAAAVASALSARKGDRLRAAAPWLSSIGIFAAAYIGHYVAIGGRISPTSNYGMWLRGGAEHLWATLTFAQDLFAAKPWSLPGMVILALVGAFTLMRWSISWSLRDEWSTSGWPGPRAPSTPACLRSRT